MLTLITFYLLAEGAPAFPSFDPSTIIAVCLLVLNVFQFIQSKRKTGSEIASLDAGTQKQYADTIRAIQSTNFDLFKRMSLIREVLQELENTLDESVDANRSALRVLTAVEECIADGKMPESDLIARIKRAKTRAETVIAKALAREELEDTQGGVS